MSGNDDDDEMPFTIGDWYEPEYMEEELIQIVILHAAGPAAYRNTDVVHLRRGVVPKEAAV